ncbi:MAG: PAS domain-containing protein [Candidatus Margulisbacteria bacterium]|nr:PAS domain-containing protein [Candidatus Margulisiibacteriota bacterium]
MVEIPDQEYQKLLDAVEYANSIINTIHEPLIVLDGDLKVVSASPAFYSTFKVKPEQTEGVFIYELGNHQWNIPKLRLLLEEIIPRNTSFNDFIVEHDFPGLGKRVMQLNARRVPRPPAKPRIILLAIEDITERSQIGERKIAKEKLEARVVDAEEMSGLAVGRELKMIELEKEINRLLNELNRPPKY